MLPSEHVPPSPRPPEMPAATYEPVVPPKPSARTAAMTLDTHRRVFEGATGAEKAGAEEAIRAARVPACTCAATTVSQEKTP